MTCSLNSSLQIVVLAASATMGAIGSAPSGISCRRSQHDTSRGRFGAKAYGHRSLVEAVSVCSNSRPSSLFWPIGAVMTALLLPLVTLGSGLGIFYFGEYELAIVPLVFGILVEKLATSAEKGEHHARKPQAQE